MFWFNKSRQRVYSNKINLDKIETIEQCRDMIIILSQYVNGGGTTPNLISISDKALDRLPSLKGLLVE